MENHTFKRCLLLDLLSSALRFGWRLRWSLRRCRSLRRRWRLRIFLFDRILELPEEKQPRSAQSVRHRMNPERATEPSVRIQLANLQQVVFRAGITTHADTRFAL